MDKELKYSGHTASPADYECPDGDLAVSMDLWPENGSLRPVLRPQDVLRLSDGQKVMFLHETSAFTHYIVYDSLANTLFWVDKGDTAQTAMSSKGLTKGTLTQVSGIGNTVIVFTTSGMRYYLWKDSNYVYLDTALPETRLSFGLRGSLEREDSFTITFNKIEKDDTFEEFTDENKTLITEQVLAKVNKFIADHSTNAGKFIQPFLVRYAYRLYDGTLTRHSAPVLMVCSSGPAPQVRWLSYDVTKSSFSEATLSVYGMVHQLDYACATRAEITALQDWKDIVKSVDIFISAPIYTYDQSGECTGFGANDGYLKSTLYSICRQVDQEASTPTYPLRYQKNTFGRMYTLRYEPKSLAYIPDFRVLLPEKSAESVNEAVRNCSSFYLLSSIKVENLTNDRTVIDVDEEYLQSLVNREVMTDDYDSHDRLIPNYSYAYNSRLNLADLRKELFSGFSAQSLFCFSDGFIGTGSSPLANDFVYYVTCYVTIKRDGRDIVVKGGTGTMGNNLKPLYFYYPDTNAYKATITMYKDGVLTYTYEIPLEAHGFLNGAVYFEGWNGPSKTGAVPSVSTDEERIVSIPNKIYTSEVNNPFIYPVANINTVGTGKIIAIGTAAKALSQGQFGQFPLYAFTTDGVWALEVSTTTGGFSAKQPITRDVCLGRDSVTQIDDAVLFATDRGIMLISGSETKCISDVLDSGTDEVFSPSSLPGASDILFGAGVTDEAFSLVPFRTFCASCRMLYDYVSYRLIVYNPAYAYAYVYSMNMKKWGMMRSDIACGVNSYPECLAMTADNRLVDFSVRTENAVPANQVLITRPLKMDTPDVLKTISAIIQRGNFASGKVQALLYGSRDLANWFPVYSSTTHYLRGFRGTPYKYYRIVLKCALADRESISGCTVEYDTRLTGQLR